MNQEILIAQKILTIQYFQRIQKILLTQNYQMNQEILIDQKILMIQYFPRIQLIQKIQLILTNRRNLYFLKNQKIQKVLL
jgi:hypothetical protein